MRTNITFLLTAFVLAWVLVCQCASAQYGWNWQNPKPQGNSLFSLSSVNRQVIFSAGEAGTIIKTTNGGQSWEFQRTRTQANFQSIFAVSSTLAWAVGDSGIVLKTTNGGSTWRRQTSGSSVKLHSVFFIDNQTGWVAGVSGTILKTTNGGADWQAQNSGQSIAFNHISFVNTNIGTAVGGSGVIVRTTNGGSNWISLNSNTSRVLRKASFKTPLLGYVCGDGGLIIKTTNGGLNWQSQSTTTTNRLFSIKATNGDTLVAVGGQSGVNVIIKSFNGGTTWTAASFSPEVELYDVDLFSGTEAISVGKNGYMLASNDAFETAQLLKVGFQADLNSMYFLSQDTGFVVGTSQGSLPFCAKTEDGGNTWNEIDLLQSIQALDVQFINSQVGFVSGTSGRVLKSTNRGANWVQMGVTNTSRPLAAVWFLTPDLGYAVGSFQTIIKTTDGGQNWTTQNSAFAGARSIQDIQMINADTGYLTGPIVQKTTNGGTNWINMNTPLDDMNCLYFFNADTGFVAGNNGVSYVTQNGGTSWTPVITGTNLNINRMHFADQNNGIMVGDSGLVLRTTDRGQTWQQQVSYNKKLLTSTFLINNNNGYIAGYEDAILKTTTGGTTCPDATLVYRGTFVPGSYCSTNTELQELEFDGTLGGSFSATPSGLNINSTSGFILPAASTPGNYIISYTISPPQGCPPQVFNTTVTINQFRYLPKARIELAKLPYVLPDDELYQPCGGDSLTAKASHKFSGLGFNWYKNSAILPDTAQEILILESGTYAVRYRNGGCEGSFFDTLIVSFRDSLRPSKPNLAINQFPDNCNESFTLSGPNFPSLIYQWIGEPGLPIPGATTATYTGTRLGNYQLQVDSLGCKNISRDFNVLSFNESDSLQPDLFVVSTQGTSIADERNVLRWNRTTYDTTEIKRVAVYRESGNPNIFELVAELPATDTAFIDRQANPSEKAFVYKLAAKKICGPVLVFSQSGKELPSVNLRLTNHPPNFINLLWTKPESLDVTFFRIFRGTSYDNLILIKDSIPADVNSYTDRLPDQSNYFYRVEAESALPYTPWGRIQAAERKASSNTRNSLESICDSCAGLVVFNPDDFYNTFSVYPNPVRESLKIRTTEQTNYQISIFNTLGKEEKFSRKVLDNNGIDVDLTQLKTGVFLLRILTGHGHSKFYRILKE